MSWNNFPAEQDFYDNPNRRYYDATHDIIDCLRQELALNDYLLANELESAALSEFDRNLLAAELYKERLMTLATSSRSQRMIVQMGAAMVRCAQANQIGRRAKRPNYNQHAVPYQPNNNYRQQYWGGHNNNNSYNSGIQRPIRKNRKRKHAAVRINPVPVNVSPGQANAGINTVKTTTISVVTTSTQANTSTAQVKTASTQVSPTTGPAKATATPAKVTATPAKPTAISAKTPTTCTVTSAQTKTTISKTTSLQTVTPTLAKTCSAPVKTSATSDKTTATSVKTTATSVNATATLVVTTATPVKAIAAPTITTSTSNKPATTSVKSSTPIICTPAPFSLANAPVNNRTVIIKPTAARDSIFAQDIDVPIPPKKSKIPVKTSVPSKPSAITQTAAAPKTVSVPGKSMLPVKKESDVGVASQKVPSLFSLNMSHIKLQFSEADRITVKPSDNIPSESTANLCLETIKNEPIVDDDLMYDDLEDHI